MEAIFLYININIINIVIILKIRNVYVTFSSKYITNFYHLKIPKAYN